MLATALVFTTLGFAMAAAPAYSTIQHIISPPTDADTLKLYTAEDSEAESVEAFINNHPLVASLRRNPDLTESRPHLKIPPSYRSANLTGGTLLGPGRVTVPPFSWSDRGGKTFVQVCHLGSDLCGHPGVVHGGVLATLLDEGLARCCFEALPHRVAMTASLTVDYRAPAPAGSYVVLRAQTTKVEGRKAWVEGRVETLVGEGETPVVLAEAKALFISPKQAAVSFPRERRYRAGESLMSAQVMARLYPVS